MSKNIIECSCYANAPVKSKQNVRYYGPLKIIVVNIHPDHKNAIYNQTMREEIQQLHFFAKITLYFWFFCFFFFIFTMLYKA